MTTPLKVGEVLGGQTVLVTGATGFMGKVLTEKLLRSCPRVKHLYLLARDKKGLSIETRIEAVLSDPLFGQLEKEQPKFRHKVTAISGDCSLPGLGLNLQDRQLLVREVTLVLHGAATVRFDEQFRTAYDINVRGTRELLELAKQMKALKGLVHISTAYANCMLDRIEEKLYDPPIEPRKLDRIMATLDDDLLQPLLPKLLGSWPNTYAFTKAVAEHVVEEEARGIPTSIFRPAIVVGTAEGPLIGWTDNLYGPTGVVVGAGCGVLRSLYGDVECIANLVPVDMTVAALLSVAASTLSRPREGAKGEEVKVYNYVSSSQNPLRWREFKHYIEVHGESVPPMKAIWCYFLIIHKWWWAHILCVYLLHYLPAFFIDFFSKLSRKETHSLVSIYRKVDKLSAVLAYFSNRDWEFTDDNVRELWSRVDPEERAVFNFDIKSLDWDGFFYNYIRGLRVYLLKDELDTLPAARLRWRRFRLAHSALQILFSLLALRLLYLLAAFFLL